MAEKKQMWCAARSRYQPGFTGAVPVENAAVKRIFVERGKKSFSTYEKAAEDAKRLTEEHNCAQWEFARLVAKFSRDAKALASDQRFFKQGLHSDVKDDIWNAVNMLESLANNMVAAELMDRLVK